MLFEANRNALLHGERDIPGDLIRLHEIAG